MCKTPPSQTDDDAEWERIETLLEQAYPEWSGYLASFHEVTALWGREAAVKWWSGLFSQGIRA